MIYWLTQQLRLVVKFFWPAKAATPPSRALVVTGLGCSVVLAWTRLSPTTSYLWSGFTNPLFQNKVAFCFTFGAVIVATSFSVGYLLLECYLWVRAKIRWILRSALSYMRKKGLIDS
jgi:hypothetical protein